MDAHGWTVAFMAFMLLVYFVFILILWAYLYIRFCNGKIFEKAGKPFVGWFCSDL